MITLLRKAAALNASEQELLRDAFAAVAHARIASWILPWRRFLTSIETGSNSMRVPPVPTRIEWAVRVASRAVPGTTCLTQALALHRLLSRYRYPSVVQVGVRNIDGRFTAHAWVEYDGRPLLGTEKEVAAYSRFFTWPRPHSSQP